MSGFWKAIRLSATLTLRRDVNERLKEACRCGNGCCFHGELRRYYSLLYCRLLHVLTVLGPGRQARLAGRERNVPQECVSVTFVPHHFPHSIFVLVPHAAVTPAGQVMNA